MNELQSVDKKILVKQYSPNLGGIVTGLDISKSLSISELKFIKKAFNQFQVLFFQQQFEIPPEITKIFFFNFLKFLFLFLF